MDFIITWVDGNDPEWQQAYRKYKQVDNEATDQSRFRSWDNLQYWFRGVEKFAPWVNKIHFVTWGHLPPWLNDSHPKLNIIKHIDYIPQKYLPTFNSHTIELNFHRIKELSEEYVYFNDDTFIIKEVKKEDFFRKGLPCDSGLLDALKGNNDFQHILLENIGLINRHFNKNTVIKKKPLNWFNLKYGRVNLFQNFCLLNVREKDFLGFKIFHLPQPFRKTTLELLWEKEFSVIDESCSYQFRNYNSINNYIQRYWELASNTFYPINMARMGRVLHLGNKKNVSKAINLIKTQKKSMICINDQFTIDEDSFIKMKKEINEAFANVLSEKSTFEK